MAESLGGGFADAFNSTYRAVSGNKRDKERLAMEQTRLNDQLETSALNRKATGLAIDREMQNKADADALRFDPEDNFTVDDPDFGQAPAYTSREEATKSLGAPTQVNPVQQGVPTTPALDAQNQAPAGLPVPQGAASDAAQPVSQKVIRDPITNLYHVVDGARARPKTDTEKVTDIASRLYAQGKGEEAEKLLNAHTQRKITEKTFDKGEAQDALSRAALNPAAFAQTTQDVFKKLGVGITVKPVQSMVNGRQATVLQYNMPGTNAPPFYIGADGQMSTKPDPAAYNANVAMITGMVSGDVPGAVSTLLNQMAAVQGISLSRANQAQTEKETGWLDAKNRAAINASNASANAANASAEDNRASATARRATNGETFTYKTIPSEVDGGMPTNMRFSKTGGLPTVQSKYYNGNWVQPRFESLEKVKEYANNMAKYKSQGIAVAVNPDGVPLYTDGIHMSEDIKQVLAAQKKK